MDIVRSLGERPEIVAIVVLVAGLLVGRLLRTLTARGLRLVDAWMARNATSETGLISPGLISTAKAVVFWGTVAIAVAIALRVLGISAFSAALDEVISFVPRLVVALAIVGVGHLLGLFARSLIARTSETIEPDSLIPRITHSVILALAVVIGIQQTGIDISFATQLVLALVVIVLGGLMLAFALGARDHVANLIGRSELNRYAVGERIRVDDIEGTIIDVHATGLELATPEGVVAIPAARFSRATVLRLAETEDGL